MAAAVAIGAVATVIGRDVPLIGAAVPGAVIGVLVALLLTWRARAGADSDASAGARAVRDVPHRPEAGSGRAGDSPPGPGGLEVRAGGGRPPAPAATSPATVPSAPRAQLNAAPGLRARLGPGLRFASTRLLQCSVVLLGAQLSLTAALRVGLASLPVMLGTLAVCLAFTWFYGRLLGVVGDLRTLIGVGTGICGASAIAAVSPVIEASSADIAYAVSTIFLFNVAAVLVFPLVGHALGMTQHSFGLFAGTAVNDTSSVVATATTYGNSAASYAVVVKLVRTLMIIPICVALSALTARKQRAVLAGTDPVATVRGRLPARAALKLVPWFLAGFIAAAGLNSAGAIPAGWHGGLSQLSLFLVAVALSAIGLSTDVAALRKAGHKPLLLGALLWVTVASASLLLQLATGTLR
ncbi:MAG TPA: putative sulfate exporter family transporter [Trebonia sp.]|nr:putative sulfate exporter family transporter [Trebonia sp.]